LAVLPRRKNVIIVVTADIMTLEFMTSETCAERDMTTVRY